MNNRPTKPKFVLASVKVQYQYGTLFSVVEFGCHDVSWHEKTCPGEFIDDGGEYGLSHSCYQLHATCKYVINNLNTLSSKVDLLVFKFIDSPSFRENMFWIHMIINLDSDIDNGIPMKTSLFSPQSCTALAILQVMNLLLVILISGEYCYVNSIMYRCIGKMKLQ